MNHDILILSITAATIGFVHTLIGPDHYLPFIVMSKARKWSNFKTIWITAACGVGHVGSSIILGAIGVALGIGLRKLELIESVRGDWAAWSFLIFGLGYLAWGLRRAYLNKPHKHIHVHNGEVHIHEHNHEHTLDKSQETPHQHHHENKTTNLTPWILFLIFVLGPCEPLIPILMYPAAQASVGSLILVTSIFAITTIGTMMTIVLVINYGITFIKTGKLERYTHAIAGATIALSGGLILIGL